jgi:hypothetical protein
MAAFEPYPNELLHVKCLLLRKQYHQCVKASSDVLSSHERCSDEHPLFGVFATFYLAMAHDELARSMHEHSAFKLVYFDKAEQHYHQVIKLLPSPEQCRSILRQCYQKERDSRNTNLMTLDSGQPLRTASALSNTQPAHEVFADTKYLDSDSDDSFEDFLKSDVHRISLSRPRLERDYSSMSLLNVQPRLTKSTSQGLLRPIRPGSPPKAYHLPPKLPYFGENHSSTSSRAPSPLPQTLDIARVTSTPARQVELEEQHTDLTRLSEHLDGMRRQINTHINLLRRAKLATTVAQAERASRANTPRQAPQKRVPQSKSFWSFTPESIQVAEKEKKIKEGRARGWARKRYDPRKYEALIDSALAEL